jgi:hypothetical protein
MPVDLAQELPLVVEQMVREVQRLQAPLQPVAV